MSRSSQRDSMCSDRGDSPTARPKYTCAESGVDISSAVPLCMDTWYARPFDIIGRMPLGLGPRRGSIDAARYVLDQIEKFRAAFLPVMRLERLQVNFVSSPRSVHVQGLHVDQIDREGEWQYLLLNQISQLQGVITGTYIPLTVRVAVRDFAGSNMERWLSSAGALSISSGWRFRLRGSMQEIDLGTWSASLYCEVASLFRRDNSAVLEMARSVWNEHTVGEQEERPPNDCVGGIVTLAHTPRGTPPDNLDLYQRNFPPLHESLQRWEAVTGHNFRWEPVS